jgi:hypothetical protein
MTFESFTITQPTLGFGLEEETPFVAISTA